MRELASVSTDELVQRVAQVALRDPTLDADDRWVLVQELHHRPETPIFTAAATWCTSSNRLLRCLGADLLGQLGCDDWYPFVNESEPILNALLKDQDADVASSALIGLGHLGVGDLEAICTLASHESADVRHAVAYCLGGRDEALSQKTLIALSSDPDDEVRNWATFGLGSLSDIDSPSLREALANRLSDPHDEVRGEAILGLALRKDVRVISAIVEEFKRDAVYALAIEAATEFPDKSFLPGLEELLESCPDDTDIRLAVERCRENRSASRSS